MLDRTSETMQPPHFAAVLRPHRSLSPTGFALFMAAVIAISFAAGVTFWLLGAWPVFGFFGLDVLLVYVAFRLNYRDGLAYETVTIADHRLDVVRVQPSGRQRQWSFNPAWVRLELDEHPSGTAELWLRSGPDAVAVGQFLSDPERRDFASALRQAIGSYRAVS
jgi:uncharacterized membrane protein